MRPDVAASRLSGGQRTFASNVATTFVTLLLLLIFSVAASAITARWLGPEGKGVLTLAMLMPQVLSLILSGGLGVSNVVFAGSGRLSVKALSANSMALTLVAVTLAVLAAWALAAIDWRPRLLAGAPAWAIAVGLIAFPALLLSSHFNAILQGLQRIRAVNLSNLAQGSLNLTLVVMLVVGLRLGLGGAVGAGVVAAAAGCAVSIIMLRAEGGTLRPRWDRNVMRDTLAFGLRGYVGNVLQFLNYRLDVFIVNFFLGPTSVGIYGIAVALAELLWQLPNAVSFVILPKASATRGEIMNRFTPRIFILTLILTGVGAVALALTGKFLIDWLFTSAFATAYPALLALLPGVTLLGGAKVLTNEIAGRGYPQYNSINAGLALILTIILDIALIPRYGILGAAIASSVAYTAIFLTALWFYRTVSRQTA